MPVFLGDALQWNVSTIGDSREVQVRVPDDRPLHIPAGFAEAQERFEPGLRTLSEGLTDNASPAQVEASLRRIAGVSAADAAALGRTFAQLQTLYRAGRNGIWPFVLRNLVRPLWLSRPDQRADVVIGNPPWVAYRHLSPDLKARFKDACQRANLWIGGKLATQQDLSALFVARATERYLKPDGTLAFVLPYAALNRPAYEGMRRGDYGTARLRIDAAWSFDETVQPLFPVPASVIIARRASPQPLPATVTRYTGHLPRRDATDAEAARHLRAAAAPWPPIPTLAGASPYRARFTQGATIVPRRFFLVERRQAGRLGASAATPLVAGRIGAQDKAPWKEIDPPEGPVERDFLRHVLLGESIAPYRILDTPLAVIPFDGKGLLDAAAAAGRGHRHLARWLREIEDHWNRLSNKGRDGKPRLTLSQRLDFQHGLSGQFPLPGLRVVYPKAGTLLCAAVLTSTEIVDHMAYWAPARQRAEADYLAAILNSETVRSRIAAMQPKGQGGARHFDLLPFELRIPDHSGADPLHQDLAAAGSHAEQVAARVPLQEGAYFTAHRRAIREALIADGVAAAIEGLVIRLLDRQ
ncbi:MAG: hypothetical protein KGJ41_05765 [Rhodospirillales bacterium]|nr:hypothetical protein [Rhodospirillales bacterium]